MGKGKRLKKARAAKRAWSVTQESRNGVRWRTGLVELLSDEEAHRKREFSDHMERLRHAQRLMVEHAADPSETFDAAWMSFCRPVIRLAFASGVDVSGVRWHNATPETQETPGAPDPLRIGRN